MNRKVRRVISIAICFFIFTGGLTGCSNQSNSSDNQTKDDDKQIESQDSVVIAISSEPTSLDPCQGWGHGTTPLVQSSLVEYLQDMTFSNDLATGYELSQDGLTWTFQLREDAYFTDGEQVTASDVVFTFQKAKESQSSLDLTFMEKAEAIEEFSVVFTLNRPTATFLNTVASIGIVPRHAYNSEYGTNPIGSGPFKFVQWNVGEQIILEANEDYYGMIPAIKKVTLVFMEESAAFAAAKAGQVDVALTSASLAAGNKIDGYHVEAISTVDNRGFTLPMEPNTGELTDSGYPIGNNVTCNLEIRQALAYVMDRNKIAEDALFGYGDPAYSENDGFPWNNPEVKIETDVEYAKKLLSENGWVDSDLDGILEKNGIKAEFTCIYPSGDSVRQAVGLAAAEQAKEIGIKINVEGTSWDDISKRMFSEAVVMGWGSSNPYTSYSLFHSNNKLKDDYYNPEGYDNETVDVYLDKAMEALTTQESYENWKLAQWDGTTGTSMRGDCPWVWLVNVQHVYFVRDGLDIGKHNLHEHGASMTLIQNLKEWSWVR